ncbi:hypothetical protein Tco_1546974 [Tanacetum coccineum]
MDTGGSPRRQETIGGTPAQTRYERVLAQPNEPPLSEGHTSGSGEGRMEHIFELTDNVPSTPHDSPLSGGYTPGSDEGRMKLDELITLCTKLSKQVLDLEKEKDAQAVEILNLKRRRDATNREIMTNVEDSSRIVRPVRSITTLQPLPTIDPKDKGKGVLVNKNHELERAQQERQRQEDDTNMLYQRFLMKFQVIIDVDHEMDKQLAAARVEAIRNKPPTKTQVRNRMITYLKQLMEEQELPKSDEEGAADYEHEKEELRMWLTVYSLRSTVDLNYVSGKVTFIVDGNSELME